MGNVIPPKIRRYFRRHYKKCKNCEKLFSTPEIYFNQYGNDKSYSSILRYLYDRMELHHVIPIKDGGTDEIKNLEPLCGHCHYETHMDTYTHDEFFIPRYQGILTSIMREEAVA